MFPKDTFPTDISPDDILLSEVTQEEKQFIMKEFGNEQTTVDRRLKS